VERSGHEHDGDEGEQDQGHRPRAEAADEPGEDQSGSQVPQVQLAREEVPEAVPNPKVHITVAR
jgi:hypothetical protein